MEDLTTHFVYDGERKKYTEEALTQITQVEVYQFPSNLDNLVKEEDRLHYLSSMDDQITLADVTARILNRATENVNYLVNFVNGLFVKQTGQERLDIREKKKLQDPYGFYKLFVFLTKPGRVIALNSITGRYTWQYSDPENKITKIFVEQTGAGDGTVDIVLVGEKFVVNLDARGYVIRRIAISAFEGKNADWMMVPVDAKERLDQVLIGIPRKEPGQNQDQNKVVVFPNTRELSGDFPLFYTQVDRATSKISGFEIHRDTMTSKKVWKINFGSDQ